MKTVKLWIPIILVTIASTGLVLGSDGEYREKGERLWREARLDVAPVQNEQYAQECGACHFAYQPGLLPARSWRHLMGNLADHFGENAELSQEETNAITTYLVEQAADHSGFKRSEKIARSLGSDETPLRISETRYFRKKHHEIPLSAVTGNPQVGSFSHCNKCHLKAADGSYDEHQVSIPGYGRWDD